MIAACGPASVGNPIAEWAEKTAAAGTSRLAISYGGKEVATAAFNYEEESGTLAFDGEVQQIVTPNAVYIRLSVFEFVSSDKLGKKRWYRGDEASKPRGLFPASPSELLAFLSTASDIEKVGTGEERGVSVTRYRARLEVDRALKELPKRERVIVREMIREYWTDGAKSGIPLDLAVDSGGRLSRVAVSVPGDKPLALEFYDYGVDVDPKPPPADEVVTDQEMIDLINLDEEESD